jgi:hypothetical protein
LWFDMTEDDVSAVTAAIAMWASAT